MRKGKGESHITFTGCHDNQFPKGVEDLKHRSATQQKELIPAPRTVPVMQERLNKYLVNVEMMNSFMFSLSAFKNSENNNNNYDYRNQIW